MHSFRLHFLDCNTNTKNFMQFIFHVNGFLDGSWCIEKLMGNVKVVARENSENWKINLMKISDENSPLNEFEGGDF